MKKYNLYFLNVCDKMDMGDMHKKVWKYGVFLSILC